MPSFAALPTVLLLLLVVQTTTALSHRTLHKRTQDGVAHQGPGVESDTEPAFYPEPSSANCDDECRHAFCSSLARFLESTTCGKSRTPCLSLSVQLEISEHCLSWKSHKDSASYTNPAAVREDNEPQHAADSPLAAPPKTWIGAGYSWPMSETLEDSADEPSCIVRAWRRINATFPVLLFVVGLGGTILGCFIGTCLARRSERRAQVLMEKDAPVLPLAGFGSGKVCL